jgi:DNA-binding NtrC family response regulator
MTINDSQSNGTHTTSEPTDLNLRRAERMLCQTALARGGSIVEAAQLLGITRHALKRRMTKHRIAWPLDAASTTGDQP